MRPSQVSMPALDNSLISHNQTNGGALLNDNRLAKTRLRRARIEHFVLTNDCENFNLLLRDVSRQELLQMRFNYDMNILQLICFEESDHCRCYIREKQQ